MATEFLTSLSSLYTELTCNINSICARTSKVKVSVSLVRDPEGECDEFFSTTLYAYNDIVELVEVGKLIEERFREKNIVGSSRMACIIDDAKLFFNAQYCELFLPDDFDLKNCFYSCAQTQIVHKNSAIRLYHWDYAHRKYTIRAVGSNSSGRVVAEEREITKLQYAKYASFSVSEILNLFIKQSDDKSEGEISKVSYFSISYENAKKTFYIVDDPFYLTFFFRNVFNAFEFIDVVGTVKQNTTVDREITICSGAARQYDQKTERTYEVTTGPLTVDEARAVEQLIMSRDVSLECIDNSYRILITDHTIEQDNDDSTLTSIKFTFRFASERVKFTSDEISALSHSRSSIFSKEFSVEFA